MRFTKYNHNPKNKKTGDCVIRAIAKAEGKEWLETYDELNALARKKYLMLNNSKCFDTNYLSKKYNTLYVKVYDEYRDRNRYKTVEELIDENPNKILIFSMSNHLSVAIRGELLDTWDCSRKNVRKCWVVK